MPFLAALVSSRPFSPWLRALCAALCLSGIVPALAATFPVTVTTDAGATNSVVIPFGPGAAGDLRNALFQALQTPGVNHTIDMTGLAGTIVLNAPLPPLFTTGGATLQIVGPAAGGLTVSGNNTHRPFFIVQGNVQISNLVIANGRARGGDGGLGRPGGGAGAGLGGGLLVDGTLGATTVVLSTVTFNANQAIGGNGGNSINSSGGGGGGGAGGHGGNAGGFTGGGGGFLGNGGAGFGAPLEPSGGGGGFSGAGGTSGNGAAIGGGGAGVSSGSTGGGNGGFGPGGGGGGGGSQGFAGASAGANGSVFSAGAGGFGGGSGGGWMNGAAPGDYGGSGGTQDNVPPGGGFGGGGGGGYVGGGAGGGFGGGGAGGINNQGGGPGAGGGGNGGNSFGGGSNGGGGGGGAGLGGALFMRAGTLQLINTAFNNNTATGGTAGGPFGAAAPGVAGTGNGGAIFINAGATATAVGTAPVFVGNTATTNNNAAGVLVLPLVLAPASIPTMGEWTLMALVLLVAGLGLRRRGAF